MPTWNTLLYYETWNEWHIFMKWKKYTCNVWNGFILQKGLNGHEINGRGYNPVMLCCHGSCYDESIDSHGSYYARPIELYYAMWSSDLQKTSLSLS